MRPCLLMLIAGLIVGCDWERSSNDFPVVRAEPDAVVDDHSSRHALDWPGMYEGVLDCEDCPGIHAKLTLNPDETFEVVTRRLAWDAAEATAEGQFGWEPGGNTIALDATAGGQRFGVGEGRLVPLEAGQLRPEWERPARVLNQFSSELRGARQGLIDMLGDHHWLLVDASDPENRRIDALFPDLQRVFSLSFADSRLFTRGGCNGFRADFTLDADTRLYVTGSVGTLMACPAPLMEADAALATLMSDPLEIVLVRGASPTLVLLTADGHALILDGEMTPEARFGAPHTVFLEIAPQVVECEWSTRDDGMCLQVRDRAFDEQGLPVEVPFEWRALDTEIEGYRHEPGIRNVLRVHRFQPVAEAGLEAAPIYVLDLVVQSELSPECTGSCPEE